MVSEKHEEKRETEGQEDEVDDVAQNILLCGEGSDLCQALMDRYARSSAPQHRHLCASAAAMRSILVEEGLPLTPPAYFAAAFTALHDSDRTDTDALAALAAFLSILLPLVPVHALPPQKAKDAVFVLAAFMKDPSSNMTTGTVRSMIKSLGLLALRVDLEDWSAVELPLDMLLIFAVDRRPKVRRCAQVCVENIFKALQNSVLINKASKVVLLVYKKYIPTANKLTSIEASNAPQIKLLSKPGDLEFLHILNILKLLTPSLSEKVKTIILSDVYKFLNGCFSCYTRHILNLLEGLFEHSKVQILVPESENIISSLTTYISSGVKNPMDTVISTSTLLQKVLSKLRDAQPSIWVKNLPFVITSVAGLLVSDVNTSKHAAGILEELINMHIDQSNLQITASQSLNDEKKTTPEEIAVIAICKVFDNILGTCKVPSEYMLAVISALFLKLGDLSYIFMKEIVLQLSHWAMRVNEGNMKHLQECVGAAVIALGPEKVLSLVPISLNAEKLTCSNAWLIPILKKYVVGASLQYFMDHIVPLAKSIQDVSDKVKQAQTRKNLQSCACSLWNLLPAFCRYPTDTSISFESLAKLLIVVLEKEPSLHETVAIALQELVNENRTKLRGNLDAKEHAEQPTSFILKFFHIELRSLPFHYSKKTASRNMKALTSNSLGLFQTLTDVFFESPSEKRAYIKIAVCMCMVHLVDKLSTGNAGSLSISLVEKIGIISNKLSEHPAFSALLGQYSSRRYSEGKQLTNLVLNDLYYHLQGELEGREIAPGHFLELSHFLLDMGIFQLNDCNCERNIWSPDNNVHKFDIPCLRARFGIDQWDYSDWNVSKVVAERMFLRMRDANIIMFLTYSQRFALKALTTIIHLYDGNIPKTKSLIGREISEPLIESSIGHLCKCLQAIQDSILPALSPHADVLKFAAAQAELLLVLSRILFRRYSQRTATRSFLPLSVCLIKSSGLGIKFFADIRPSTTELNLAVKLLLMLLLSSIEFCYPVAYAIDKSDLEVKLFSEVSMTSMGLLPVLCKYIGNTEFSDLSVASVDLMLKGFLAPNIWLPILQKHLQLQHVVQKIQQNDAPVSFSGILNFLLTLACIKGGAELLHSCNIFSSLKVLFSHLLNDKPFSNNLDESGFPRVFSNAESHGYHWGLGLAIVSSMINALGDDFSCTDIVDSAICYFFSEKAYIMSSYISAPTFPADDHSKKRTRTPKTQTSLTELRLTEHTLMLMCVLARHQASWIRGMKEIDSELRETSIHLLAFISRGPQRIGDLPIRTVHPLCPPTLKEEVDLNGRPSFVNSKNGWFTLSAIGISTKAKVFAASSPGLSLAVKDRPNDNADLACHTHFSDTVAIQIYRIAFLVLKFLCTHAKAATRRAEEVEFIDLAHFPELPMPEILHGLQDQAIAIVTEVCEVNGSKSIQQELEGLCLLLLQILEKSLYLELCVSQSCGIRPVLGRIEHFSKEFKQLMQVVEHCTNLKASLRSLGQIITLVYPGLLQTDGLF